MLYDAALRNLQTLSETTQHLPDVMKAEHPHVPWREISGFRNILVHNYLGNIDPATVAAVVDKHLAPLAAAVSSMLATRLNRHLHRATVACTGQTGVEMEALTACSVALLTTYDMCKAVDRGMTISGVRLMEKRSGKSGHFVAEPTHNPSP